LYFCVAVDQKTKGNWQAWLARNPQACVESENALHKKRAKKPENSAKSRWDLVLAIGPFTSQAGLVRAIIAQNADSFVNTVNRVLEVACEQRRVFLDNPDSLVNLI
jgi:hypothetical protein